MRRIIMSLALLGLCSATPALSQDRVLLDLTGFKGDCDTLRVPEGDLSSTCHWAVMNLNYDDGRRNFSFFSGEPTDQFVFAFSGTPDLSAIDENGIVTMAVDVLFTGRGTNISPEPASGECRFNWPYTGEVKIACTAKSDTGEYTANFISNGEPPIVTPLH